MSKKGLRGRHAPKKAFAPTLPAVNLLPASVMQVEELRRLRRKFIAAGVVTVAVVAGLFAGQEGLIRSADSHLQAVQQDSGALSGQQKALAPIGAYYNGVTASQKTIMQAMSKEARFADTVDRLKAAAPQGVALGNINLVADTVTITGVQQGDGTQSKQTASKTFVCPTPDPFKPDAAVGCITLAGTAPSRDAIGQFINNLNQDGRFVSAFVSTTTVSTSGVAFSATIGVTQDVYSKRYQDTEFLKGASK